MEELPENTEQSAELNPEFGPEPKLSGLEVDKNNDEIRSALLPQIKELVERHELFADKNATISYAQHGISSLVCKIETVEKNYILKAIVSSKPVEGEGLFLNEWESVGVSVPHVIEEGKFGDRPYLITDFIDVPVVRRAYKTPQELLDAGVYGEMGATLRMMHGAERDGFGEIHDGVAEFENFGQWLESKYVRSKIEAVRKNELLGSEHGSIEEAFSTLHAFAGAKTRGCFCHNDFSLDNIFDTRPLTVFDPNPMLNERYIDIGKAIVIAIGGGGGQEAVSQMVQSYFKDDPEMNPEALKASILFNAYLKFGRWSKVGKTNQMELVKEYLTRKHNLTFI